jgi:hypothetical protein
VGLNNRCLLGLSLTSFIHHLASTQTTKTNYLKSYKMTALGRPPVLNWSLIPLHKEMPPVLS